MILDSSFAASFFSATFNMRSGRIANPLCQAILLNKNSLLFALRFALEQHHTLETTKETTMEAKGAKCHSLRCQISPAFSSRSFLFSCSYVIIGHQTLQIINKIEQNSRNQHRHTRLSIVSYRSLIPPSSNQGGKIKAVHCGK